MKPSPPFAGSCGPRRPLGPALIARIAAWCEAEPEREACGFVLRRGDDLDAVQVENVADPLHAADPVTFPRRSRDSFFMDPLALSRIHGELARAGGEFVAVWHSHVEAGAYLSAKDRADAVVDGILQVPGADQLVLGLRAGRVFEVRRYRFGAGEWAEVPVEGP